MGLSRREFLRNGGIASLALSMFGGELASPKSLGAQPAIKYGKETTTICPFCGVGCGIIVQTSNGKVINTEGDPNHPINQGALCTKGSAIYGIANNPLRLAKVKYRAPGSDHWDEKTVEWAIDRLAKKIKATRDLTFVREDGGVPVNRCEGIASIGGSALDNEECYLISKLMRAIGIVYLENQARLCHSSTVAALGPSFGRGAMTNHWTDIRNSDCVFIIGSNPANNHPMSFRWITKAREKGAKLLVADPRFNRSAAAADLYVRFRPGTDVTLIGGMINYAISNRMYNDVYVREYTDAPYIVDSAYDFKDGLFSGYDSQKRTYNTDSWSYVKDPAGKILADKTLENPRCVFQLLKKHYARYTPEMVSKITGIPIPKFIELTKAFCSTYKPDKVGTILYAMGATQHTIGVEYIRAYSILQLLLGNIGVPGGGINAMRGESNVQGATDMCLLFHLIPGYMSIPRAKDHPNLRKYLEVETPATSYWSNKPKFFISMLKAFWGDHAVEANDFCYDYLPKVGSGYKNAGYSWIPLFEAMHDDKIKGLLVWGMNPSICGPNGNMENKALEKLDWMAAFDLWETDTSIFWKRPGASPHEIYTEVFLFPAAASFEKEGSISNSGRWIQWRYKAVEPPGDAKSDVYYVNRLALQLKELYSKDREARFREPIIHLNWNYGKDEPDVHVIAKEMNGYTWKDKQQLLNFTKLTDDGSTACGCWIYSGFYPGPEKKDNKAAGRSLEDKSGLGVYPNFSYAWPLNRRILYNRCSANPAGEPWNNKRALIMWDKATRGWITNDVPDFGWKDAKTNEMIPPDKSANAPYIMLPELHARLFVPRGGIKAGPFPEHYEPFESPVKNFMSSQQINPAIKIWDGDTNKRAEIGSQAFPIVATTYRLTEHWQAGAMTRNLPWLAELMPEMYVEMSPQLAKTKGIKNGEWVEVVTIRGKVPARANVTERIAPLNIGGKMVEIVAMPWHYGFNGYIVGGPDRSKNYSVNQLTAHIGDSNTMIPEYKVFLCDIKKYKY